jgi:hypothetical protein
MYRSMRTAAGLVLGPLRRVDGVHVRRPFVPGVKHELSPPILDGLPCIRRPHWPSAEGGHLLDDRVSAVAAPPARWWPEPGSGAAYRAADPGCSARPAQLRAEPLVLEREGCASVVRKVHAEPFFLEQRDGWVHHSDAVDHGGLQVDPGPKKEDHQLVVVSQVEEFLWERCSPVAAGRALDVRAEKLLPSGGGNMPGSPVLVDGDWPAGSDGLPVQPGLGDPKEFKQHVQVLVMWFASDDFQGLGLPLVVVHGPVAL